MNVYFELNDKFAEKHGNKYIVAHNVADIESIYRWYRQVMLHSERAWLESDIHVEFIKHRWEVDPVVDMKEFMWIKLKCI